LATPEFFGFRPNPVRRDVGGPFTPNSSTALDALLAVVAQLLDADDRPLPT